MIRIALLMLVLAGAAHAQLPHIDVTTVPAVPSANAPVRIVVTTECGCPAHLPAITRNGNTFDVAANPLCLAACGPTQQATYDVGRLAPGVYTVRHYFEESPDVFEVIGSFEVVASPPEGIVVRTEPAVPNVNTPVTLIVENECGCPSSFPLVRDEFTIDVPFGPLCLSPCLPTVERYELGILPRGIYTVRSFPGGSPEEAFPIGSFAVVGAAIPTLEWRAMLVLAAALVAAGWLALRR